MKKVALFTTTRAEFGILSPLISAMEESKELKPLLFVGGTHLSKEHGNTIKEIKDHGYKIAGDFDYLLDKYDSFSLSQGLSIAIKKLANIFRKHDFNFVCFVGDRYELLSIVSNAIIFKKPIIHIHGGEKSEGAIDEQIRHMITKAAHLHFVSCEEYGINIQKMGEPKWRIHNTGALGIDNIAKMEKMPKDDLFSELSLDTHRPTVMMTYHPVTLEYSISPSQQARNMFEAFEPFDLQIVITGPNIEVGRDQIVALIKEEINKNKSLHYFESLGVRLYSSLIPYCEFVIGNSSSGIIDVPYFKVPTVNIGDRQNGRIRHASVIDTDYSIESITQGIERALSKEFKAGLKNMKFKFGAGRAAERMINIIKDIKVDQNFMRKKLEFMEAQYE